MTWQVNCEEIERVSWRFIRMKPAGIATNAKADVAFLVTVL
jgi:hypothetical protein